MEDVWIQAGCTGGALSRHGQSHAPCLIRVDEFSVAKHDRALQKIQIQW